MLDLWEANRRQLVDAGVRAERITVVGECTACARGWRMERRRYFSHRGEKGVAGRMLNVVGGGLIKYGRAAHYAHTSESMYGAPGGLAPLDNPPFAIKLQRMGHPAHLMTPSPSACA